MDLRISAVTPQALGQIGQAANRRPLGGAGVAGAGFADNFKNALQQVSSAQNQATQLQREVQLGNPKVSLEETMLAMQKAQIGFQATLQVRNRLVSAYSEIMNMQI